MSSSTAKRKADELEDTPDSSMVRNTTSYPYMNSSSFKHLGPADTTLNLADDSILPCHAAILSVYSGVLRELLHSTRPDACTASSSDAGVAHAVPLSGDDLCHWLLVLQQMYHCLSNEAKMNLGSAEAAVQLANKYDMPVIANLALGFVNSQYTNDAWPCLLGRVMDEWQWAKAADRWNHQDLLTNLLNGVAKQPARGQSFSAGMESDSNSPVGLMLLRRVLAVLGAVRAANSTFRNHIISQNTLVSKVYGVCKQVQCTASDKWWSEVNK